jgi:hypothetical protein
MGELTVMRRQFAKDKELEDNARLLRAWRKWHAEQLEEALAGVHRDVLERLMEQLKALRSARELVGFIATQNWSEVDADTRLTVLHQINTAIPKLREKSGMEPIDDPLPGQPDNASRIIKRLFESFPPSAGKHTEVSSVNKGVLSHE